LPAAKSFSRCSKKTLAGKAIGIEIPQSIALRADHVIE
jgi:hypothetical protein